MSGFPQLLLFYRPFLLTITPFNLSAPRPSPSVQSLGQLPHIYALSPVQLDRVLLLVQVEAAALPGQPLETEQGSAGRRHLERLQFLLWGMDLKTDDEGLLTFWMFVCSCLICIYHAICVDVFIAIAKSQKETF